MTNLELANAYFDQAKAIYQEILMHLEAAQWNLVVRRSQECVELLLKGLLRKSGLDVPRLHDVGNLIRQNKERFSPTIVANMDRIVSVSRQLRQEREVSFYGDEEQELPASAMYTQIDAQVAKENAEWMMQLIEN